MQNIKLSVQGMTCGHCVKAVEASVGEIAGVKSVKVDLKGARAEIAYDPAVASPQAIIERLDEEGYKASLL